MVMDLKGEGGCQHLIHRPSGTPELGFQQRIPTHRCCFLWSQDSFNLKVRVMERCLSVAAAAPRRDDSGYDGFVCELENAFSKHEKGGKVSQNYITECYLGSF